MLQVFFALVALIAASIHVAISPKRRSGTAAIVGTYLIYFLFIYVGLMRAVHRLFSRVRTGPRLSLDWMGTQYHFRVRGWHG